jgi:hypothetical protein
LDRDDGMSRQSFPAVRMKKRITPNLCVQVRIGSISSIPLCLRYVRLAGNLGNVSFGVDGVLSFSTR